MSKNVLIGALVVVIIILAVILLVPKNQDNNNFGAIYSPSPVISPVPSPSQTLPKASQGVVIDKITVLSPNGGEVYVPGDILKITWKAPQTLQEVEISISQNCPKGALIPCSSVENFYQVFRTGNTGSFSWQIPLTIPMGSYYSIAIADEFAMHGRYSDSSDLTFTIITKKFKEDSQKYQQQQNQDRIKNDVQKIEALQTLFETRKGYYANSITQLSVDLQEQLPQPPAGVIYSTNAIRSCAEGTYLTTIGLKNPYCFDNKTGAEL